MKLACFLQISPSLAFRTRRRVHVALFFAFCRISVQSFYGQTSSELLLFDPETGKCGPRLSLGCGFSASSITTATVDIDGITE